MKFITDEDTIDPCFRGFLKFHSDIIEPIAVLPLTELPFNCYPQPSNLMQYTDIMNITVFFLTNFGREKYSVFAEHYGRMICGLDLPENTREQLSVMAYEFC